MVLRQNDGFRGLRQKDGGGFDPYLYSTKRSITTMPSIFRREVVDGVLVRRIFGVDGLDMLNYWAF